jgi:hypothetical protein
MSAFLGTLFGNRDTVAIVVIAMAAEALLVANDQVDWAPFAVPSLVLAGVAWLATR